MSIFDKWNEKVNGAELANAVKKVEKNGGSEYPKIPIGEYEVHIEKMELKESKKGDPMFAVQFKILDDKYKGNFIFMNQVLNFDFQIFLVNKFLHSLVTGLEIIFDGDYSHYNDLIFDVAEEIDKCDFLLEYGENKKGYNTFEILEVYDA